MPFQTSRHRSRRTSGTVSGITSALTRPLFDHLRADHGQHGVGEQRQGDAPVPAVPLADFILVQPGPLLSLPQCSSRSPSACPRRARVPPAASRLARSRRRRRDPPDHQLRRASSQCSQSRSRSGRMASRAQSESRGPFAPSPALRRVQSVGATVAAMSAADRSSGPRSVSTHSGSVRLTASTKGWCAASSHSRSRRAPP